MSRPNTRARAWAYRILAVGLAFATVRAARAGGEAPDDFFEARVRPVLVERCLGCHGPEKSKGGLRLDSREAVLRGGESGAAAVAGKPDESAIVAAVRYAAEPKMPPKGKLPEAEVEAITRWVAIGLPWPGSKPTVAAAPAAAGFTITDEQRRFWSFQPVKPVRPPDVHDAGWPQSDLDRFVLAGLEAKGLRPAPEAERRALARRVTFDLTGLPPTPEEVEAFVGDASPAAYEALVDRLLASPRFGERWGRHWLDVVRYTDSFDARIAGSNNEMDCNDAWRYRDWVVDAVNRDLPYDRFVTDQIAGDLVPTGAKVNVEGTIATGALALGNWGGGDADKEKLLTDIADDQVDLVSRAFMGLTVACARCHDHKFDPISTKDYYGLAGIFFSTHILANVGPKTNGPPMLRIPLDEPPADPKAKREMANGAQDGGVPGSPHAGVHDVRVHVRGNYARLGDLVPRRFPEVVAGETPPAITAGSGRLELARWLTGPDHPLTARVIVNRVWQSHFGTGIVRTPSNFGALGERPTHPELLDFLARRLVDGGWSLKALHRELVLSATYRQSAEADPKTWEADPGNRLYGRMNRRRLEAEPVRDALLAAAGRLDGAMRGPSTRDPKTLRRALYVMTIRSDRSSFGPLFDAADPTAIVDTRTVSTVAPQALYLLNNPWVIEQASAFARRLAAEASDEAGRVDRAYRILFGRQPTPDEARVGREFLAECGRSGTSPEAAWSGYCQMLLCTNEWITLD